MGGACSADGEERGLYRVFVGKPDKRDHWGDLGVDKKIILGCIFRKRDMGYGLDWTS
jgi:hypothetical protein